MTAEIIAPLLGSLFDRGRQFLETPKGLESEAQMYQLLQDKAGGVMADFRQIETLLSVNGAFSTTDAAQYIRFPDVEEGGTQMTPLVYLDGHFRDHAPYLRLQVILVIHANAATTVPRKMAMRFETPEKDGKHSYYHSQMCVGIQRGDGVHTMDMVMEPEWMPTSHPAWPMDAESPTELLICLILTLYGKVVGGQIINEAGLRCGKDLFDEVLGGMRTKFRDPPTPAVPKAKKAKGVKKAKKSAKK